MTTLFNPRYSLDDMDLELSQTHRHTHSRPSLHWYEYIPPVDDDSIPVPIDPNSNSRVRIAVPARVVCYTPPRFSASSGASSSGFALVSSCAVSRDAGPIAINTHIDGEGDSETDTEMETPPPPSPLLTFPSRLRVPTPTSYSNSHRNHLRTGELRLDRRMLCRARTWLAIYGIRVVGVWFPRTKYGSACGLEGGVGCIGVRASEAIAAGVWQKAIRRTMEVVFAGEDGIGEGVKEIPVRGVRGMAIRGEKEKKEQEKEGERMFSVCEVYLAQLVG